MKKLNQFIACLIIILGIAFLLVSCEKDELPTKQELKTVTSNTKNKIPESEGLLESQTSGKGLQTDKPVIPRAKELKDEITVLYSTENSLKAGGIKVNPITDLYVSIRSKNNAPDMLGNYHKIDVDLNKGAGGKWIYLYYERANTLSPPNALTDISYHHNCCFSVGLTMINPDAWAYKIVERYNDYPADLNDGCGIGSHYVYLTEEVTDDYYYYETIKHLMVISSTQDNQTTPYGYTKVDMDLNKGAGGDFIYLYYKK